MTFKPTKLYVFERPRTATETQSGELFYLPLQYDTTAIEISWGNTPGMVWAYRKMSEHRFCPVMIRPETAEEKEKREKAVQRGEKVAQADLA
jgi:hypothetical protein